MAQARADRSAARASLLDAFDRQHQVEATARLVARHLTLGHPPDLIISALARALLREDAGFHAYQILDAGVSGGRPHRVNILCRACSPIDKRNDILLALGMALTMLGGTLGD